MDPGPYEFRKSAKHPHFHSLEWLSILRTLLSNWVLDYFVSSYIVLICVLARQILCSIYIELWGVSTYVGLCAFHSCKEY
jgi:hypothetical protein